MDKVDGYDAADLRVLLDRAALSAARRAFDRPDITAPDSGQQKRLQLSSPSANGHLTPPVTTDAVGSGAPNCSCTDWTLVNRQHERTLASIHRAVMVSFMWGQTLYQHWGDAEVW